MAGLSRREILTAGVALLVVPGCNQPSDSPSSPNSSSNAPAGDAGSSAKLSGDIKIDGSSTVFPITEAVAEEFRTPQPHVKVTVGVSGTGGGFKKFGAGEIDISDASRPIKDTEIELAKKNGVEFIELPVAYDALSIVVHPENDWAQDITVAELKKIWEPSAQGKVTKWSQVRAGWPETPLKLYGPGTDSGTFDYFTSAIVGEEKASRGDYTASEDDNMLVQGVSRDKGGLGYFGLAYLLENEGKLKALPVNDEDSANGDGPQAPTVEGVQAGTYQPLARPIFIYVSKKAVERPEIKEFVRFYLQKAPELVKEVGYVPLQPDVYQLALSRFDSGTTGSMFEKHGSQVGVKLDELMKASSETK